MVLGQFLALLLLECGEFSFMHCLLWSPVFTLEKESRDFVGRHRATSCTPLVARSHPRPRLQGGYVAVRVTFFGHRLTSIVPSSNSTRCLRCIFFFWGKE